MARRPSQALGSLPVAPHSSQGHFTHPPRKINNGPDTVRNSNITRPTLSMHTARRRRTQWELQQNLPWQDCRLRWEAWAYRMGRLADTRRSTDMRTMTLAVERHFRSNSVELPRGLHPST